MDRKFFNLNESGDRSPGTDFLIEQLWVLGLFLTSVLLYGMDLNALPLRDWDEGIVAQVARDIWRGDLNWLYPTLGGQPYLNKPPLVHLLIALAYKFAGVNEWATRWPPAMLTALSVPLLYGIGREVFVRRTPAVFAALIYLTLLPVVRHGRLAMLDGAVLCFFSLMVWCALRSRRNLLYALGVGIGLGLICFTKGILGLLLGAIVALFLLWDTPRLLASWYLWIGILLGTAPVAAWYVAQWQQYSQQFINTHLLSQSFSRIWGQVEGHAGPPWYYLLEILKYSWPWLLFWPQGLHLAWENRNLGWAKLVLVWSGVYLLAISIMGTKLPWYVLPIYPAVAIACGAQLAEIWHWHARGKPLPPPPIYSWLWIAIFTLLALGCWAGCLYFGVFGPEQTRDLLRVFAAFALTLTVVTVLIQRQNPQFILILFWGSYVSLCLFVTSSDWVWELAEDYPVKPVAAIVQQKVPSGTIVYTSHPYNRPSLNFYSDRLVVPAADLEDPQKNLTKAPTGDPKPNLKQLWQQEPSPYFLLNNDTFQQLALDRAKPLGNAADWTLVTRETKGEIQSENGEVNN